MNPDLTKLVADHRAQLLAEMAICEASTKGPWMYRPSAGGPLIATNPETPIPIARTDSGEPYRTFLEAKNNAAFIATARTALPDRIRENLRMLDALSMIYEQSCPDCGAYAYAESALRDILMPKENA